MTLGTIIGIIAVFSLIFGFALCAINPREDDEIIERRIREVKNPPDHPGQIVPFERRRPF